MRTAYTGGTFDLLHPGHFHLLAECARIADGGPVVVALNTDAFVLRYKGVAVSNDLAARRAALLACRWVDAVVTNVGDEDSRPAIEVVAPDVIVIGADWRDRDYHAQMGFDQAWLDERGISIEYVELLPGLSSTRIREGLRR